MGYDLHITRTADWTESASAPIGVDEWVVAARASAGLTETAELSDGSGNPTFVLGDDPSNGPALYWHDDGRVVVRGSRNEHVPMLVAIAAALDAQLIGDDGEAYGGDGEDNAAEPSSKPPRRGMFRRH